MKEEELISEAHLEVAAQTAASAEERASKAYEQITVSS